jgi:hypothetical protein
MADDELAELLARMRIAELVDRYGVYIDAGEFDDLERLFSEDAVFDITPDPGIVPVPIHGSRRIRDALEQRYAVVSREAQRRHLMTNLVIDELTDSTARSRVFLTVLSVPKVGGGVEVRGTGVYNDRFERRDGRWVFAERKLTVDVLATS